MCTLTFFVAFRKLKYYDTMHMICYFQVGQSVKRNPSSGVRTKLGSDGVDRSIQAYHNMNRFLAAFLEHVCIVEMNFLT